MEWQVWIAYFVASWAIALSPGSGAVLSMTHGLAYGVRGASATIAANPSARKANTALRLAISHCRRASSSKVTAGQSPIRVKRPSSAASISPRASAAARPAAANAVARLT